MEQFTKEDLLIAMKVITSLMTDANSNGDYSRYNPETLSALNEDINKAIADKRQAVK